MSQSSTSAGGLRCSPAISGFDHNQAGTVHDLGNLIQVVSSALNIISRELSGSSKLVPVIATARSSIERATTLVRQSLGAARDVSMCEWVDLERSLIDLLPTLQSIAGPEITIALSSDATLPRLHCNAVELGNVVLNLVLNARDAMSRGGLLSITLVGSCSETAVSVTDTGCGMTPETKARAFDPFFTTKGERGGSGVGLPMVRRFAEGVGGRVEVDSTPGVGTTISLLFPVSNPRVPS